MPTSTVGVDLFSNFRPGFGLGFAGGPVMKKCRITVLKRNFDQKLAEAYVVKDIGLCPMHEEGEVFYGDFQKPDGLCDEAWKAIYQYCFALAHSSGTFYYGDWMGQPDVAITCCNDGLRPVVFKIERTDEESTMSPPAVS